MAEFGRLMMTDKGSALVVKALQGSGAIRFTGLAASARRYQEEDIKGLVSLEDIRQRGDISEIDTESSSSILLRVVLPNTDLTEGYYIRTVGLYANDPEEGEILYGVSMETSDGGCYMPPYNHQIVSSLYFHVSVAVGSAEIVQLEVDAGAVVTRRQLDAVQQKIADAVESLHESMEQKADGVEFDSYKNTVDSRLGDADIAGIGDGTVTGAISELNTGIGWTKVWENENDNLYGLNYLGKTLSLNLDGYHEFRVIFYVNGTNSNHTVTANLSPRTDGNLTSASIIICNPQGNGGIIIEGREVIYNKSTHVMNIKDGWRWTSPNTYGPWHGQIKPAYIEAR